MKCFKELILLFLISSILASCSFNQKPEKVTDEFMSALVEKDFQAARKYSSPETGKLIDLIESLERVSDADEKSSFEGYKIISSRIDGDFAYVEIMEKNKEKPTEIKLIKSNGKWLVHITKADIATKDVGSNIQQGDSELQDYEPEGENSDETTMGGQE